MSKIKVGILGGTNISEFFLNGLFQNAFTLAKLLDDHPDFDVILIDEKKNNAKEVFGIKASCVYSDCLYDLDVLITVSKTLLPKDSIALQKKGVRIISIKYGNSLNSDLTTFVDYSSDLNALHTYSEWMKLEDRGYTPDLILYSPHYNFQREYLAVCNNTSPDKVIQCPYVWSPMFIELISKRKIQSGLKEYSFYFDRDDPKNKNIACTEPALSFVKTNLLPMIVVENLYNKSPDSFSKAYLFGSKHLLSGSYSKDYLSKIYSLSSFRDKKVSLEQRVSMPEILSKKARVLLSHQKQNSLNYTYFEYAFFKLPFVHNSDLLKRYGYYYEEDRVIQATSNLEKALQHKDLSSKELLVYNNACDEMIWNHSPCNPKNISEYVRIIKQVL